MCWQPAILPLTVEYLPPTLKLINKKYQFQFFMTRFDKKGNNLEYIHLLLNKVECQLNNRGTQVLSETITLHFAL